MYNVKYLLLCICPAKIMYLFLSMATQHQSWRQSHAFSSVIIIRKQVASLANSQALDSVACLLAYYQRSPEPSGALWIKERVSDCRLREPGFEFCAAVLKPWASFFTLYCSSSLSCRNEYLTIDSGGYVYEQPSRNNCSIWLGASQRSRDGV